MNVPAITLSGAALRDNVRTWKQQMRVDIRAVVKANGYGFGLEQLVRELDGVADGFVVSDVNELERLRALTEAPAATLYDGDPADACRAADLRGIVNIARLDSLATLAARSNASEVTVRVGLRFAAGWSAIDMRDAKEYAMLLSGAGMHVELWTHLSNPATEAEDREQFARFVAVFQEHGVDVVGEDVESTFPAARGPVFGNSIRVGVGLFGAGMPGRLKCAIDVRALVLERIDSRGALAAGYGPTTLPAGSQISVLRCGYSDGFPHVTQPYRTILSVGMQYSIVRGAASADEVQLLGPDDDLDQLAAAGRALPHQIVTGLGLASQRHTHIAYNEERGHAR